MKRKQITTIFAAVVITLLSIVNVTISNAQGAVTTISLNGNSIAVTGSGAKVDGSTATITAAGTYSLSGKLTDGQIVVDTQDDQLVTLILNGADLRNTKNAPLYIKKAKGAAIVLADGTQNYVSDGAKYTFAKAGQDEPNAAIFSDDDLTISGGGTLTVEAHYNDGIASKDGLTITNATITVQAVDDGIRGKDHLTVTGANLTVTAQGDGLKADNAEDSKLGFISIGGGVLKITAGGDAISAETVVTITDGQFSITAGGGSRSKLDKSTASAKGIKAGVSAVIGGGTFTIDSADDAIHSNANLEINAGTFTIAAGDDGIHADATLQIKGGTINIKNSYEGIESAVVTISGGTIHIVASDDGLNVAGGRDGSGAGANPRGQDRFAAAGNYHLYIRGGYIAIDANGDGVDANGSIEMTDGVVIVHGTTANMNSAVDYDRTFKMTGGFLVAVGSSGMAQTSDASSSQYSLLLNLTAVQQAKTLVHIQTSQGENVLTFLPTKAYQSIAFSSPKLTAGAAYNVYLGGSSDGQATDGLYQAGTYKPGTQYTTFKVSSIVTQIGSSNRFRR